MPASMRAHHLDAGADLSIELTRPSFCSTCLFRLQRQSVTRQRPCRPCWAVVDWLLGAPAPRKSGIMPGCGNHSEAARVLAACFHRHIIPSVRGAHVGTRLTTVCGQLQTVERFARAFRHRSMTFAHLAARPPGIRRSRRYKEAPGMVRYKPCVCINALRYAHCVACVTLLWSTARCKCSAFVCRRLVITMSPRSET